MSDEDPEMTMRMAWTLRRYILSDESESSRSVTRKTSLTKANYIFVTFTFITLSSECPQKDGLGCERLTERRASLDKVATACWNFNGNMSVLLLGAFPFKKKKWGGC